MNLINRELKMMVEEQGNPADLTSEAVQASDENGAIINPPRKSRHRKKALHAAILKLMEFYFSDANLNKDRYLCKLIEQDPFVDLDIFLKFNKIRNLTQETCRIAKALKNSTILELSEDEKKVRRTTPICKKVNMEDCVIYVEGLTIDTDHDWLSNIFSRFGSVDYVSIPRYNNTKKIKGYAFVEFSKAEDAQNCLKEFADKNCTLPSLIEPHDLLSIKTFSAEDQNNDVNNGRVATQQPSSSSNNTEEEKSLGKRSLENGAGDDCTPEPKKLRPATEKEEDNVDKKMEVDTTTDKKTEEQDEEKKKQKKKNRKRRDRNEQPGIEDFGLRIMSKHDWRVLRNKYLNLQRGKMNQLKQSLMKTRLSPYSYDQRETAPIPVETAPTRTDDNNKPKVPKFEFVEGLIIKIELDEPCINPKDLKSEFKNDTNVKYIDIHDESNIIHLRCDTAEGTNKIYEKYSEEKTMTILTGNEEQAYWDKMTRDRAEKFNKENRKKNKQRGRDKLLKKAEKELGKHIRFDDV